jgi:hypothetical protein
MIIHKIFKIKKTTILSKNHETFLMLGLAVTSTQRFPPGPPQTLFEPQLVRKVNSVNKIKYFFICR